MNEAKLLVIGDETVVYGFGQLGIEGRIVHSVDDAELALHDAIREGAAAIILITDRWARAMRSRVDAYTGALLHPLVLELPTGAAEAGEQTDLRTLLRQALGIPLER